MEVTRRKYGSCGIYSRNLEDTVTDLRQKLKTSLDKAETDDKYIAILQQKIEDLEFSKKK
jgi:hypothetical protein